MEFYVFDGDLQVVDIIDDYKSMIWAKRYRAVGDCEIYVAASTRHISSLTPGNYIVRNDDLMICRIVKVELTTNPDEGDYLTVTGRDMSSLLDQRIIWGTETSSGLAETFVRGLVQTALIDSGKRQVKKTNGQPLLQLGAAAGLTDELSSQMSYSNIGEVMRELCERFGWGYKVERDAGILTFKLYAGSDLSSSVIFSEDYGNLITTDYIVDHTSMSNVALVGGAGEGAARVRDEAGTASGIDRYEIFIDARNESKEITWKELKTLYPLVADGGYGSIITNGSFWAYQVSQLSLQIYDTAHQARLQTEYPGGIVVQSIYGQKYYRLANQVIADLQTDTPTDDDKVTLRNIVYKVYLVAKGYEVLAQYGEVTSFNAEIDPDELFKYRVDYNLGDIVGIKTKYGIDLAARIAEVIEYDDDTGYHVAPTLEYI